MFHNIEIIGNSYEHKPTARVNKYANIKNVCKMNPDKNKAD